MDVSTLLKRLQLLFPPPLRGASNCQDIDIGSCHSDFGSKERGNDFILILHYCKQEVLKHLDATLLDFILLFSEFDDERFSPINVLYALGSLAFKEGNIEYLGNVQTVVIENYDSPDAIFLMNDLGVMLSLQGMYKRSEECFSKAKKWFQQEEDHLKNAVVTLNLAALYMILGEYKKACEFCNDAADLCHGFTMRSTKDIDLPMKVLRRTADLLSECGNFEKFCHILRIGGKYNFGARKASKIDVRKWLMEIQLKEQTGEKVEEQELKDCSSYLLTFLEKPDAQSLNADLMRTVFTAARVNHRNGLYEEAFKLLEKLESTLLLTGGRKDLLYGLMLFLVGQFKYMYGCGMTVDAENDLKQADAILEKHFGRNHLFAYCKKLLGSCALLNNNLGNASTNLAEASAFFEDLNSKHYEVADISFKLAQLQIEGNFEDAKEIQNAVQKAVEMLACSFGRISPKTGSACVQAGLILQKVDKGAAINEVNKAVEIYHSLGLQLDHPVINLCQGMTGLFQLCSGNKEEAEKYFVDALKESPETDESCHGLHHDNMCEVDNLVTEFSNGYFREKPLYRSAKMFSLVGLVAMKKGKDIRRKYLDVLVSLAEESDTEEHGIIDFAGHCCFVSHISCLAGPNVYFFVFPDPEVNSQSSNDDEVIISRSKNSSCILFWRTSCKIQEMKELRNLDFHICESVRALFLQPKFGKSYNKTNDFYLELPLQTLSLCAQIDCLPLLVEVKLGEPCKEHANFDNLTSSALEDSSPEPAVHVSYLSYEFSNKRTAELAFDYLAFSASKEPLLNDVKAVEVADGHSPYMNFAFFSSQHSRYSHFSVFVDKELPVLRVKCRHLSESKSNGFCCSVKSALENVMYFLCEDVRISFKPFVQLSCGVCSMVGFRGSLDVTCNCIVATKTESSVSSPQAEEAMFNNFARDCFTEKELDCSTKQVLNSVTCRHSTLFHHQGSSSEASTSNCSNESDQNPFSSSRTSLCGAKAQVLKSDFDKECHVSKLQNQEVCSGSHADVYLRLLEYLLSDRNVTPEHEALNSVVPDSGVEERSLLSADFLSASSWNSVPVSPESFCSRDSLPSASSSPSGCISLHEKFEGEPCEWSDVDLANSCLAKVQNKSETKETHRYAEICLLKSQLSEEETPDNCDSIDGVLKQLESNVTCEEPFGESKEYPDVQIGANCHPQCKNSLEEIELSAAEGTGVRGSRNSGIDRFVLSKDEESATFQNNCFELQQQINKLEEKLRQTEAEKQQLKADLGRYLFLEDREKRTGKLLSAPRAFTGDEIRCCGGSTSSKCLSATGKLLGRTASLQDKPESSGTSSASLPSRDDQGGERCTTLKSCTSTMGFAHRSEDNGQKFTPDHVYDLSASASFNIDSENPVSINIEDNDPLSMESVGTNDKEGICVPVSSEQSGPSSGASSVCVNALRTAEGSPVCSRSSSQGSSKKSAKAPEVVLTSHSASAPHRVRPYFGACHAAAVGNKSYVRSDGSAFSDVSIGGFERVGLLGGSSNNESLYGSSAHAAAAPLRNQTGLSNVTLGWNGSSSNGVNNVDGFLNIDHGVTGQRDYSRESYFPYVQQSNTVSEITRSGFAYGLTSSDFTLRGSGVAGIRPLPSVYTTQRHVMSDGDSAFKDEQAVNERSHNADLALGHQSLANINRYHVLGTSASAGSAVIVDNCGLPPPFSVSSSSVSSTTVVSTTTSRSLVVSASNHTRSLVNSTSRNSVVSSTTPGDGNSETSLAPSSRNADEDHSRGALLNRDNGMNDIEPIDDSLLALEGRVADASALVERVLGEREEWEQFEREMERKERMNRERRERERREREEREMQEAEQWPQQQEAVSARSPWLCEHYQRHCRVRFPCCTQFYPCHRCHNTSRNCENEEAKACHVTHLKCSFCEHEQEIDENSGVCGKCGAKVAAYLCSICKHFTNVDKNPYHCEKCGICRIHAGKSCQCEVCNVCLDKRLEGNHECRPDSSHNECYNCLEDVRSCLLSNRNVRPELEALNSVVLHIESIEEHSFPSSAFPSPSLNSLSVSLGDPFNQEESCDCSDEDLAAGCLAKAQSKPETKETHHYADVFQLKTELNEKENSDNCDSIDGVPKQLGSIVVSQEPLGESNECPDMQIGVNHHPQCQNSLEEMEVSAANDTGVRTPRNRVLDPFMLSKEEESATFQNNCFELLKQINELKEQLRQREAENQQLKAEVGRYLFLEDREKRSGKLLSVPRVSASDDSKSCGASASSKCVTTNGRLLGGAESPGTSTDCVPSRDERLQDLEPEQGEERCANHMSINMKENDPLSMESVGTNAKESICVPNSPNKSGPSSDCSIISVSSSDSLVLSTAEGTSVSSSSSSQRSSEKSAKASEVALTTHSAAARGEIASESNLDTGSSEEEVPALAQLLNSTNDLTDGGNIEVGDIEGQSVDLCYGALGTSRSDTRSPLSECDLQISSSDSYAFCPLADPENLHVGDGNLLHLQQSSNAHGQTTLGMHGSDVASSSSTGWECLGARPKSSQTQRPLVAISPPPPPLIVSPISDGLAGDFLVRHSQDIAVHESLFSNGRDFSFLGNDTSQGVSFVEGSTNASEAYRVRPCFGACQVAVGNNSYVRSDGNAFSHVPSGNFERARLLAGISYNESLYRISPPTAAAPLAIPTGPSNVTMGWNGSSRDGANNVDGFLNTDHRVTGQRDYSRESYFPYVQHNTHVGQVPIHWQSNASSRITSSGFAYGLTSSGFTFGPLGGGGFGGAGVRPRQSLHATQRHVVSDGDSVFIDEQTANEMSHDADLALGRQSLANRNHELPTSAGSAVIVDNCGLPLLLSVSAYSINSTRGISATTSHPLVVSASNGTRGLDNNASRNSVLSSATPVDENAETSLAPVSVNVNENNSRGALLNRDNGTYDIEPIDDSLLALERRVADASALDERMLREREEREQFAQEIERRERMIRETRERERREREEREIPDGVRWLQELEDTSFGTPKAL